MAKATGVNWFGSSVSAKRMKLGIPGGPAATDGGCLFLENATGTGGGYLFTDGTNLRFLAGGTAPTDTQSSGDALGVASGANFTLSNLTIATTGDVSNTIARTNATGTAAVLQIQDAHATGGTTLLVNSDCTDGNDALQITHDGTGYGLSVIGTAVTGKQALFQGPASQTTSSVYVNGATGSWIGAANVGMLHLASDGALANADASLIYSTYTGAVGAAQVTGTCAKLVDAGAAGTNTWALGITSTNNSGAIITTSAVGMSALKLVGPSAQTASMLVLDGTTTNGWGGAATTGMLHIMLDGATLNATASAIQVVIGTGTPTDASTGYALRITDTTTAAATPASTYAAHMTVLANSGLNIVTGAVGSRNLVLSGIQAQTAAMVVLDGTTGTGWTGAATTGMLDISGDATLAATTASLVNIKPGAGTPQANSMGYAVRVADTTAAAATSYAVYISAANNEALKVDDGFSVFDEGIATKLATTDVANPPTNANMITAFGAVAAVPAGFIGIINDAAGGLAEWLCWSDGTKYWYVAGTAGA